MLKVFEYFGENKNKDTFVVIEMLLLRIGHSDPR
jgi:hypothetical protein